MGGKGEDCEGEGEERGGVTGTSVASQCTGHRGRAD